MPILAISRAVRFSPDAVSRDARVFSAVVARLRTGGFDVRLYDEDEFAASPAIAHPVEAIVHMARSATALQRIANEEQRGILVVNSATALLRLATRKALCHALSENGADVPPFLTYNIGDTYRGGFPLWAKALRGDAPAHCVSYITSAATFRTYLQEAQALGVTQFLLQAPQTGILLKFYGIAGTAFARLCLPSNDTPEMRRELEKRLCSPDAPTLEDVIKKKCHQLSEALRLVCYGGDAIVDEQGRFYIIDFNDFPSYGLFAEEAAASIAQRIIEKLKNRAPLSS